VPGPTPTGTVITPNGTVPATPATPAVPGNPKP
jgi:hypothetical protein